MSARSVTRYARSGDVNIAYQAVGDGPFDLVFVPGAVSHVDLLWDDPDRAGFFGRLASFCRLIVLDKPSDSIRFDSVTVRSACAKPSTSSTSAGPERPILVRSETSRRESTTYGP